MTGRFPTKAEALLDTADFSACIRDDAFDAARTDFIVAQLRRLSDTSCPALPQSAREGAMITVDSFVGRGGHWCYWSTQAADCLPIAAILCWLGDFLAGAERRTLQSCHRLWSWPLSGRRSSAPPLPARQTLFPVPFRALPRAALLLPPKPALAEHSGCAGDRITE